MEHRPNPTLPRAPDGLENRRRLRDKALSRLAAEEQFFAVGALSDPAPQPPGSRRRVLRTVAQVFAILFATFAAPRRLIPAAWAGQDSSSDQAPDNSSGNVYGGPPPDAGPGQDPNTPDNPGNSPGQIYGGPPPDGQEDQNETPEDISPPDNPSPLQQPVQPNPPAPVYGGPPPGASP